MSWGLGAVEAGHVSTAKGRAGQLGDTRATPVLGFRDLLGEEVEHRKGCQPMSRGRIRPGEGGQGQMLLQAGWEWLL